ncbi:hypothetical protein Bhyg_04021 [Pseudolycoriella hygida]|uniref:Uncharacterized protein n=1 Tax=Pseudolycoriella hygida TaxID=35572 RepID=A0A9Q0S9X0_9DIPT|nr:hypothetical protein Bhyg_04021 [Pseudolycoriella hygida]
MVNLATQKPKILDSKMHFDREFIGQYTYDLVLDNIVPEYIKILGTDYRNFAVEWSCVDLGPNQCKTYVYVLTEKPIPDKWVVDRCNRILEKHNIDLRPARFVIQDDRCFATKDN